MDGCFAFWEVGCVIDWNAWAALATAAAVISGAVAVWLEARRASRMQRADWAEAQRVRHEAADAEAAKLRDLTAVLAMAISKEAWRAIAQLRALLAVMDQLEGIPMEDIRGTYANGLPDVFSVSRQAIRHLAGFKPIDANAILNAVAVWREVPIFGEPLTSSLNHATLLSLRPQVTSNIRRIIVVYGELMHRMTPYVKHMEGVNWIEAKDLIAANEKRVAEAIDQEALRGSAAK